MSWQQVNIKLIYQIHESRQISGESGNLNFKDNIRSIAESAGANVISEPRMGYERACLTEIDAAGRTDVYAFINGNYSNCPEDLDKLIKSVAAVRCDLAIGCRE